MSSKNMLDPIIRAMVGVQLQFLGVILDLCNKLAGSDGKLWYEKIRTTLREGVAKELVKITRLLAGAEALPLPACDGTRTVAQAEDVFKRYIDHDFKNWGLDVPGIATPATHVQVHEQIKNGTFQQLFTWLSSDMDKLAMTQHQIVMFCQEHHKWLRQDGYATLFLFKEKGEFFVAYVRVHSGSLYVGVIRFEYQPAWPAEIRPCLVTPQLEAEQL